MKGCLGRVFEFRKNVWEEYFSFERVSGKNISDSKECLARIFQFRKSVWEEYFSFERMSGKDI